MYTERDHIEQTPFSGGRMLRGWVYLLLNFILGTTYFSVFSAGFFSGIGLLVILIGIPILLLTFASARWMTTFDRRFTAALFGTELREMDEEIGYRRSAPPSTLHGVGYVLGKFLIGILSIVALSLLVPLFILELALQMGGLNTGQITARITHALTVGLLATGASRRVTLPDGERETTTTATGRRVTVGPAEMPEKAKRKRKNDHMALALDDDEDADEEADDEDEIVYYLGDDGEIHARRR
jgi:hypothetical protein